MAEAVTLAHVARIVVLARSLDPKLYQVRVACDARYHALLAAERLDVVPIFSLPTSEFQAALAAGKPVYSFKTLEAYAEADLELMRDFSPDLVIGDFRLSLSASARVAKVPYATVTNAYWSPFFAGQPFPIPVLPLTRVLPIPVAQRLFDLVGPLAMRSHCRPVNLLRARFGLAELGNDLRRVYTDADEVLYADDEGAFAMRPLPSNHRYLGPLLWSPAIEMPTWWNDPVEHPQVYVTMGSSGSAAVTSAVMSALDGLPLNLAVSLAGAGAPPGIGRNVRAAPYLNGALATERSVLVICNGGSMTCQQAMSMGKPVLGIASNMDQFLNMQAIVDAGAGLVLRADRLSVASIRDGVRALMQAPSFGCRSAELGVGARPDEATERFCGWVEGVLA